MHEEALALAIRLWGAAYPTSLPSARTCRTRRGARGANEARTLHATSLARDLKEPGPGHSKVARHRRNLARALLHLGDLKGALALMTGPSEWNRARSQVAEVLEALGYLPAALKLRQEALASSLGARGESSVATALSRAQLARLLADMGDLPAAQEQAHAVAGDGAKPLRASHRHVHGHTDRARGARAVGTPGPHGA